MHIYFMITLLTYIAHVSIYSNLCKSSISYSNRKLGLPRAFLYSQTFQCLYWKVSIEMNVKQKLPNGQKYSEVQGYK